MPKNPRPVGYQWLISYFQLQVPPLRYRNFVHDAQKEIRERDGVVDVYMRAIEEPDSVLDHLKIALKQEPLNLIVWCQMAKKWDGTEIVDWISNSPTSAYARRAWFIYEYMTQKKLPLSDSGYMNYVDLLPSQNYVTTGHFISERHKVRNNLLGLKFTIPMVRMTPKLSMERTQQIKHRVAEIWNSYDAAELERAVNWIYHRETKSSFDIEREKLGPEKSRRFIEVLHRISELDISNESALTQLQNAIVDERYAEIGYRQIQNYVGESFGSTQKVHYVCPKPEDVKKLMDGWVWLQLDMKKSNPVIGAAILAFLFVYIHPFEDGNGRIHRLIFHKWLDQQGFLPKGGLIPVSAAILRNITRYYAVLEDFSRQIESVAQYELGADDEMKVLNETVDYYRFIDLTQQVEFFFDCLEESIDVDFKAELEYLSRFDRARKQLEEIIDMPNRRAASLIQTLVDNRGQLSKTKRSYFSELSDAEIASAETIVSELWFND